ncbi:MAG: hypothetical protein Q3971_01330 [Moraxella sp.]|nr:hypothetical protein [Moraxella sp.]
MKLINTAFRENEEISWQDLENLLKEGIYEEEFLVLSDSKHPDYVQIAEINGDFVVKVRLYMEDNKNFQHFKKHFDAAEDSIDIFKALYHDEALSYDDWEDISDQFN